MSSDNDSQLYDTIKATALGHIKAYSYPGPFNNDAIQKYRTPDCVHNLHPQESIPDPFNKPIDRAMFTGFMSFFGNCTERFEMEVKDLVIDTQNRSAVARLDAVFDFKAFADEPALSGYSTQYMWMMIMEETGMKIKRVEEFLDPDRLMNYVRPRAQRYLDWTKSEAGGT